MSSPDVLYAERTSMPGLLVRPMPFMSEAVRVYVKRVDVRFPPLDALRCRLVHACREHASAHAQEVEPRIELHRALPRDPARHRSSLRIVEIGETRDRRRTDEVLGDARQDPAAPARGAVIDRR